MPHHDDARLDDLLAHLGDSDSRDLIRLLVERGMRELIDAELSATIGAELHERTDARTNQRNGCRTRTLSTPAGDLELRIPKLRVSSWSTASQAGAEAANEDCALTRTNAPW